MAHSESEVHSGVVGGRKVVGGGKVLGAGGSVGRSVVVAANY